MSDNNMSGHFSAVKVSDHVHWVGAVDWGIRDFHGYKTRRGSTYNAYLILADKITLVDTVKAPFFDELMARISSVIDPKDIDYIISNHSEMDHTGSLPRVVKAVEPQAVYASVMGVKALSAHFHGDVEVQAVKDGEELSLGDVSLHFIETRMLHWPDSMLTYLADDRLLFSQDGFGMHLATSERFADEIDACILRQEAASYFANILMPYAGIVAKNIEKLTDAELRIRIIAPDHGPVWRENPMSIVQLYSGWANKQPTDKALVAFDTMWHSTGKMASAICDGLSSGGARAVLMPLHSHHRSDVATEILDASALIVGSPTLNNNILPSVADMMTYLKGLRPTGLIGAAFGSHGWSGESVKQLEEMLGAMKVELVGEALNVKYVPDGEALAQCHALGEAIAGRLKYNAGKK